MTFSDKQKQGKFVSSRNNKTFFRVKKNDTRWKPEPTERKKEHQK